MKSFFSSSTIVSHRSNSNTSTPSSSNPTSSNSSSTILSDVNNKKTIDDVDKLIKEVQQFLDSLNPAIKNNQIVSRF